MGSWGLFHPTYRNYIHPMYNDRRIPPCLSLNEAQKGTLPNILSQFL